jgi:hypothetical protein
MRPNIKVAFLASPTKIRTVSGIFHGFNNTDTTTFLMIQHKPKAILSVPVDGILYYETKVTHWVPILPKEHVEFQ